MTKMKTTRTHKEAETVKGGKQSREFMHAILADLRALERMIAENIFETGVRRIGAEQEMFLIDDSCAPPRGVIKLLEQIHHDLH